MTLGEYLKNARKERGYSLRDISARCNVSAAEISRIETGTRLKPAPATLQAIAEVLVIDYSELLRLSGYMPENSQKEKRLSAALTDPEGNLKDLYECAEEMYETDKEWLQEAWLVSKEMTEQNRKTALEIVRILRRGLEKSQLNNPES